MPTLYLLKQTAQDIQTSAYRMFGDSGNEVAVYMVCRRLWANNAPAYIPVNTFVPGPGDYERQSDEGFLSNKRTMDFVTRKTLNGPYHLFAGHTHPPDSLLLPSEYDNQAHLSYALTLQAFAGQRNLLSAILDHYITFDRGYFEHWQGAARQVMRLDKCDQLPRLSGRDYTEVGSLVDGFHRCTKLLFNSAFYQAVGLPTMKWQGELMAGSDGGNKVWEDTPAGEVMIKIIYWPKDCNCGRKVPKGEVVPLSYLGYSLPHPWRRVQK